MLMFRTLDQHVKWKGELIPPYTEVEVSEEDMPVWNELVRKKVAEGPQVAMELPEDDQNTPPVPEDDQNTPPEHEEQPTTRRRKPK